MTNDLDPTFAAALRTVLVERPRRRAVWRPRRPFVVLSAAVVGLGIAGGAAAAVNAVLPGAQVNTALSAPVVESHVGTANVTAGDRPPGATALWVEITCDSSAVSMTFPDGGWTANCGPHDPASTYSWDVSDSWPVPPGTDYLTFVAADGDRWTSKALWVDSRTTDLATNAAGVTYGVDGADHHPGLIAVIATNGLQGYAYSDQLEGPMPTSPAQALEWQERDAGKIRRIPVYKADGKTVIGEFEIGGP